MLLHTVEQIKCFQFSGTATAKLNSCRQKSKPSTESFLNQNNWSQKDVAHKQDHLARQVTLR